MSLSDEIKAAIGGDGKSRHQTRCLYDSWAIKAAELEASYTDEYKESYNRLERIIYLEKENARLQSIADNNAANGLAAEAENSKLREALQFYAFSDWNENYPGGISYEDNGKTYLDNGEVAKIALKEQT